MWIAVPDLGDDAPPTGRQAHGDELHSREGWRAAADWVDARRFDGIRNQLTHQQPRRFDKGIKAPAKKLITGQRSRPVRRRGQCRQCRVETKRSRLWIGPHYASNAERYYAGPFLRLRLSACN